MSLCYHVGERGRRQSDAGGDGEGSKTMTAIEISCSQCGSNEYRLVNARTGEVVCQYCRNQWIVPELVQKSETEKFLEQQAQQPRVIYDNTTETDKQLMGMITSLAGGHLFAGLRRGARTVLTIAGVVVLLLIGLVIYRVFF
jgi:uncharacterized Zn finger protein (UPF0148 family)